jgi:lipid A 3-O-deacylase
VTQAFRLVGLSLAAAALFSAHAPVQAQGMKPPSVFVQGGFGKQSIYSLNGGVAWPWDWKSSGGGWTGYTELLVGVWSARAIGGGRSDYAHIALSPIFRYHFDSGSSPVFFEGGIGLSLTSPKYLTPTKTFGSQFNFADTLGIGYSFGDKWDQDVTLRLQHLSNAGIKKPNPGEEFLQLRYTWKY